MENYIKVFYSCLIDVQIFEHENLRFFSYWVDMIKEYKMSKYIFKSFLKKEKKNIFEIDILMIPLQVDENDVLMLLIYICSYMYNLLEHFSVSE